jgi:Uma2 family endonuclease
MTTELTQANKKLTFEEYLNLDAEDWVQLGLPEGRCEYIDGELVELPPESEPNNFVARYLLFAIASSGIISLRLIAIHRCEIEVPILEPGDSRTRYPDVVVLREEHLSLTKRRFTIRADMPPPQLVVEVLSPRKTNRERDVERKRKQYQQRGIPEYWVIDPNLQTVIVMELKEGEYVEVGIFQGDEKIVSPLFSELQLIAEELFVDDEGRDNG